MNKLEGLFRASPAPTAPWGEVGGGGEGLGRGLLSTTAPCSPVDAGCDVNSVPYLSGQQQGGRDSKVIKAIKKLPPTG